MQKPQDFQNIYQIQQCSICLQHLSNNLCSLQCGHVFHQKCIEQLLKVKHRCPNCRLRLTRNPRKIIYQVTFKEKLSGLLKNLKQQTKKLTDQLANSQNKIQKNQLNAGNNKILRQKLMIQIIKIESLIQQQNFQEGQTKDELIIKMINQIKCMLENHQDIQQKVQQNNNLKVFNEQLNILIKYIQELQLQIVGYKKQISNQKQIRMYLQNHHNQHESQNYLINKRQQFQQKGASAEMMLKYFYQIALLNIQENLLYKDLQNAAKFKLIQHQQQIKSLKREIERLKYQNMPPKYKNIPLKQQKYKKYEQKADSGQYCIIRNNNNALKYKKNNVLMNKSMREHEFLFYKQQAYLNLNTIKVQSMLNNLEIKKESINQSQKNILSYGRINYSRSSSQQRESDKQQMNDKKQQQNNSTRKFLNKTTNSIINSDYKENNQNISNIYKDINFSNLRKHQQEFFQNNKQKGKQIHNFKIANHVPLIIEKNLHNDNEDKSFQVSQK